MKSFICKSSGALIVLALTAGAPDLWAQARGHGGGGGGGARTPSGGASGGGGTAVSRGGGSSGGGHASGGGGTRASGSGGARTSSAPPSGSVRPRDGGRPNNGNPVVGQAVQRPGYSGYPGYPGYPNHGHGGYYHSYYPYYPYYYPYWGWGFGVGFSYYDPYWWGYGYPGYYGGGYSGGYGGSYSGGGSSTGEYDAPREEDAVKGGLKLKVEPSNAEVYVDGYYAGVVDDFNGPFQRLNVPSGKRRVEIRANGFQALTFDVIVEPRVTVSYSAKLQPQADR